MHMGMRGESLPPGMQDAEEADSRAQVLGIGGNRLQSFGAARNNRLYISRLILQAELDERLRQREYDMEIFRWKQFGAALFQPFRSGQGLALGAIAIGARIIGVALVAALVTLFQMAAERRRPAQFDIAQRPLLARGQRGRMRPAKLLAVGAHYIGDF